MTLRKFLKLVQGNWAVEAVYFTDFGGGSLIGEAGTLYKRWKDEGEQKEIFDRVVVKIGESSDFGIDLKITLGKVKGGKK